MAKKTCFVVMGYGKKMDYQTSRTLDLNASYENIIKPAVEAADYECIRSDEIPQAGNINVKMYEQLLNADVVVADVSTYNVNAFYELGVRHALRPYTTITIAEDKLVFPFDIGQIAIIQYHHLGEDIGASESRRMIGVLKNAIEKVGAKAECDSPVYTFLSNLKPPVMAKEAMHQAAQVVAEQAPSAAAPGPDQTTVRALMDQVDAAMKKKPSDFLTAKTLLSVVRGMMPNDSYVVQRLALATYKSKIPTTVDALKEAEQILLTLAPESSTDTETLGLYGSVQKRLWEETKDPVHMDKAIWALEKGFYVKNDYYNGINLAYMLNVRADMNRDTVPAEAITDFIVAERTRRKVLSIAEAALKPQPPAPAPTGDTEFWIKATIAEAYAGLGDDAKADESLQEAKKIPVADWMIDSPVEQLKKLRALLAKSPLDLIKQLPKAPSAGAD
jgi:hypothetical protein